MTDKKSVTLSVGPGFLTLLAILFIGLKLTGHITWPWIWVLGPLWIPPVVLLTMIVLMFLIALLVAMLASNRK